MKGRKQASRLSVLRFDDALAVYYIVVDLPLQLESLVLGLFGRALSWVFDIWYLEVRD